VSSLTVRRVVVWVVSMVLGFVLGLIILTVVLPLLSPDPNAQPVSIQDYGIIYFLTTVIPLGLIFVTVLDAFLDTRIWPD
jgi:hypothetical protein